MARSFQLDIVTAESRIYSGRADKLFVQGINGEFEVLYNHAPFLTALAPGPVWVVNDGKEEGYVIFGGTIEVQPEKTIILADTAVRAKDIDEAQAEGARHAAEAALSAKLGEIDYAKARAELANAVAQLRLIRKMRGDLKK